MNMQQPDFENPAEAARAWAAEYEARIAAEKERDKAKTERGQISSRREATALARTMLANREVKKLTEQFVKHSDYATAEQVSKATDWPYEWHPLRQWCNQRKQKPIDLEINDNTVKAWPASAWKAVFGVDILALREDGVLV